MKNNEPHEFPFVPIIILGAPRSGTNALRNLICEIPDAGTWPCDEINSIWRHGNIRWPNDEIPVSRLTSKTKAFIRRSFFKRWLDSGKPKFIVEKTCANTLRVPFVLNTVPEAIVITIIRNGLDVVPSAVKRWQGEMELPEASYLIKKLRYVPRSDLLYVLFSFLKRRMVRLTGGVKQSEWGPRWIMQDNLLNLSIEDLCALQWCCCVDRAEQSVKKLPPSKVLRITYEMLVSNPHDNLRKICAFLDVSLDDALVDHAAAMIKKPQGSKNEAVIQKLQPAVRMEFQKTLRSLGY